ncbi:MAG: SDR family oxidoreductase [Phycisphaerae bacterium]
MADDTKVALVTGGAKRVGRAVAQRLLAEGWAVAVTYNSSRDEAEAFCRDARAAGGQALAIQADFLAPAEAAEAVDRALTGDFARLDLLVNNASIFPEVDLAGTSLELLENLFAVNVFAPLLLCRTLAGRLQASNGCVVNLCDILSDRPWAGALAYSSTKAALVNLTKGLAKALGPACRVNGISPGVVAFPPGTPQEQKQAYLKRVPLGEPGTPQDVAALVCFLATQGRYITGQVINLDGGRSVM